MYNGRFAGLALALVVAAASAGWSHGAEDLAGAKTSYRQTLQKIEQEHLAAVEAHTAQYEQKLDQLAAALQKKGDLDGLLAANKEKARYMAERTIPDTTPADLSPEVAKLQEEQRTGPGRLAQEKSQKIVTFTKQYLGRLEQMKKDLTTQGKITDAVAVKEEIARVESSESYALAREDVPAEEEEPKVEKAPTRGPPEAEALRKGLLVRLEASGNTEDSSGNGHHAVNAGAGFGYTADRQGAANRAFVFRQPGGAVVISDPRDFQAGSAFTLAAWINPRLHRTTEPDGCGNLIQKWYSWGAGGEYMFALQPNGTLALTVAQGVTPEGACHVVTSATIPVGQWTHVAATFERGVINVYINGTASANGTSTAVTQAYPQPYPNNEVKIGGVGQEGSRYNFDGALDDILIYNRALGRAEVKALMSLRGTSRKAPEAPGGARPAPKSPASATGSGALPRIQLPGGGGEKLDTAKLYRRAVPSVVVVASSRGHGSGFTVGRKDIFLTNAHVVGHDARVKVYAFAYQGEQLKRLDPVAGDVVYRSEEDDIAVVKVEKAPPLMPLPVARKSPPPGTKVFAIGSPGLGDLALLEQSITEGIISSAPRDFAGHVFIQHTAAVNPGNSGGPLFNEQGEVVGMVTLKALLEGVSFAIPAGVIRDLFEKRRE